jgi:hypothetical protein
MNISISNNVKGFRQIMPAQSAFFMQREEAAVSFFLIFLYFGFFRKSHFYTNLLKVFGLRLNKLDSH